MADLAALRRDCREARRAREAARRALHDDQARLAENERLLAAIPAFDLNTPEAQSRRDAIQQLQLGLPGDQQRLDAADGAVTVADAAYDAAAAAEPALFAAGGDLPLLLLPVRVETVFRAVGSAAELWIRVYPDEIHVDSHERELTDRERAAGETYWREVWAAGPDEERRASAWRELLLELGAARAAWALEALRPAGAPPAQPTPLGEPGPDPGPFPDVGSRAGVWTRAAHTKLLPDRLVFSGYRAGRLMWRVEGAAIPDVLPVAFAPPGSDPAPPDQSLPWDSDSRWLVDFDAAVANGMGTKVPLDDPDLHYDLVTVTGVTAGADPLEGARRADELLTAHAYTDGLDVLPAGTPTNNTSESRSGWRSREAPRPPRDPAPLREPAAGAVRALAIDGAEAFATVADDTPDDDPLTARVHAFVGRLLGLSADWSGPGAAVTQTVDVGYLVEHFTSFVRSRGPLPTLRVGRQPYGVLPATALGLWRGDDVDPRIVAAVESVLSYFGENVHRAPRVGTGPDQDAVIVDLLSRRASSRRVRHTNEDPVAADVSQPPATIGIVPPTSPFALRGPVRPPASEIVAALEPTPELRNLVAQTPLASLADVIRQIAELVAAWDPSQAQPDLAFLKPQLDTLRAGLAPLLNTEAAGVMYPLTVPVLAGSVLLDLHRRPRAEAAGQPGRRAGRTEARFRGPRRARRRQRGARGAGSHRPARRRAVAV